MPNFSQIETCICDFCKVCEKKENWEINFFWFIVSWEWLNKFSSNLECGLPQVEGTSIVNLVPFGSDIMELWMRQNCDFAVPVNILTPFACAPFLELHVCLDDNEPIYKLHFSCSSKQFYPVGMTKPWFCFMNKYLITVRMIIKMASTLETDIVLDSHKCLCIHLFITV